jgi:hypothetical protein
MFFLIRCVFWLTVVFTTIFNADQSPVTPAHPVEGQRQVAVAARQDRPVESATAEAMGHMTQAWVSAALQHFWGKASGGCAEAPAKCATIAARLTEFAREHPFKEVIKEEIRSQSAAMSAPGAKRLTSALSADVPLPPPRPRQRRPQERPAEARSAQDQPLLTEASSRS